jgi:hypothetical protein
MRRVLVLGLLVALGLSAELWVNAIHDPGAELGQGNWETDFFEWPEGAADSAKVEPHDTTRAFEGEYSFLTDTDRDPGLVDENCDVWCYQSMSVPKAVQDIDSCSWMVFLDEDSVNQDFWRFYIIIRSTEKKIVWQSGVGNEGINDTACVLKFPLPDSGDWRRYEKSFFDTWVNVAGWSANDTISEIMIYSDGYGNPFWKGQEVSWDNIVLQSIAYYDYAAKSIDSDADANEKYIPVATFANEGILDDKDGVVFAEILDGETRIYIDSQSVSIPAESSEQVTFGEWTVPHDGSYTLRVYPILELDEFAGDDTLELTLSGEGIEEYPVVNEWISTSSTPVGIQFSFSPGVFGNLSIYDASGREVHSFTKTPDSQVYIWNTQAVPSGLYFYNFKSSGLLYTDKLVVIH